MQVVFIWRVFLILFFILHHLPFIVRQSWFGLVSHGSVWAHHRWAVVLCLSSRAGLASRGLDYPLRCLVGLACWDLALNILVVLVGVVVWALSWSLWLWGISTLRSILAPITAVVTLEVVWKSVVLGLLLLLQVVSLIAFTLTRDSRQLLLRLWDADATSRLRLLVLTSCRSSTRKPNLLILAILIMFYCQFGLTGLNLVRFLAYSFSWNIIALLFFFLLGTINLKMSGDESWGKLIFGNSSGKKFWNSTG